MNSRIADASKIVITELPDGEILIDGKPADFSPPWKTEDAICQLLADLAAVTAERDTTERRLLALHDAYCKVIDERDQLRARLAAIDAAPTVARIRHGMLWREYESVPPNGTELIARPAKGSPATNSFEDTRDPEELDYDEREE